MDHISVGHWLHMTQGVSRFIEGGREFLMGKMKNCRTFIAMQMIQTNLKTNQLAVILKKKKNLQERMNALLMEKALQHTQQQHLVRLANPQHAKLKKLGRLHCLQQNEIINLFLVNCWKKTSMVVLVQGLEVA